MAREHGFSTSATPSRSSASAARARISSSVAIYESFNSDGVSVVVSDVDLDQAARDDRTAQHRASPTRPRRHDGPTSSSTCAAASTATTARENSPPPKHFWPWTIAARAALLESLAAIGPRHRRRKELHRGRDAVARTTGRTRFVSQPRHRPAARPPAGVQLQQPPSARGR